jgi:hypothetical protein
MTEDSLDLTLISAKIMKPVLAEVDDFARKHGLSRNKSLNLLLSLGLSYWKELMEKIRLEKDAYVS